MYNIIEKEEYVKRMEDAVKRIADTIKLTFGGKGKNIIVESKLYPFTQITNDAQTIIQAIKIKTPAERIVVNLFKELCDSQDKNLGNGRKTTILMAHKILEEGNKYNVDKNELKKELDSLIPLIESEIDKQTKEVALNEIVNVAETASENKETGRLLQEIYEKIGRNGKIQCEGSGTYETFYRIVNGVRFDMAGYYDVSMAYDENARNSKIKETKAIYEKPLILVTKKKIISDDDINPLLNEIEDLYSKGKIANKNLVIFTQNMDEAVSSMLVGLHQSHRFNICIVKVPSLWRDYYYEDFAKCTGATIIDDTTGKTFKNMHLTDLGTCSKITIEADETIINPSVDISEHIAQLQQKGDNDSKLRLGWLNTQTALLKLGSNISNDLSLKLLKTYDAIRSSELALKYGIVKGGGRCLWEIANTLPHTDSGKILAEALRVPEVQNFANGVKEIDYTKVIDASMVVKKAVRHAIGISSTILTASSLIYLPDEPNKEPQNAFQN